MVYFKIKLLFLNCEGKLSKIPLIIQLRVHINTARMYSADLWCASWVLDINIPLIFSVTL